LSPGTLLVALLRGQFRLAPPRSLATAFLAARAAVFQVGRDRADYQRALPYLERYYAAILAVSETPFDAARAARLELDWWIVHREAAEQARTPDELERALARLAAELYQVPAERLGVHAARRAVAMTIRDRRRSPAASPRPTGTGSSPCSGSAGARWPPSSAPRRRSPDPPSAHGGHRRSIARTAG
jgi:hypothetical protein